MHLVLSFKHGVFFAKCLLWTSSTIVLGLQTEWHSHGPTPSTPHSQVRQTQDHNIIWTSVCLEIQIYANPGGSGKPQKMRDIEATIWRTKDSLKNCFHWGFIFDYDYRNLISFFSIVTLTWISALLFTPLWIPLISLHSHATTGPVLCWHVGMLVYLGHFGFSSYFDFSLLEHSIAPINKRNSLSVSDRLAWLNQFMEMT